MRLSKLHFLLIMLMSMTFHNSYAFATAAENADGVMIYYNIINNDSELEVTYLGGGGTIIITYKGDIVIPEEVTILWNGTNKVTYKVTSIGEKAFALSTELTSVTIPNSITSIGEEAFHTCTSLTSIIIPNNVKSLGHRAFLGCSALKSINIPNGITAITQADFLCCTSLTSIDLPNSIISIDSQAFEKCSSLSTIVIPNSVTSIGSSAFEGCNSLSSINIPNSVTAIGQSAFLADNIQTVVSKIENPFDLSVNTFSNNTYTTATLYVPAGTIDKYKEKNGWNKFINIVEEDFGEETEYIERNGIRFKLISSNECEVAYKDDYRGVIEIPEKVTSNGKEYTVTSIGEKAFYNCHVISIFIPNSVTSIGDGAFRNCEELTSVNIPNNVTQIGEWAFCGTAITSVTIPIGVTTLSKSVFNGCDCLTSVTIPNSVTSIGYKAFYRCQSLASINIPNSVTTIDELAFWECRKLTSITIPNNVTNIGAQAFNGEDEEAPNIQTVVSLIKSPFEILGKTSYNKNEYIGIFSQKTFNNATLYVPKGTIDKYKATDGWKDFAHIEENPNDTGLQTIISNNRIKDIYSINGEKLQAPSIGFNIIKMNNGTTKKILVK